MTEIPTDPLAALPVTTPRALVEVYKSVDTLPASPLANYLAVPSTIWKDNGQGHQVPAEADYSRATQVKANIEQAALSAAEGSIGVASLIGGLVNGHYDVGTDAMPNLRTAFEHLDELFDDTPLRASTSFHNMFHSFRSSDAQSTIGYIYKGVEPGSPDEMQVVHAARLARYTGRPVLHTDETGKPGGKLIPLTDKGTGTIVPNVFLQVRGSIYSDENGSASAISNMAFANLIVLPERLLEANVSALPETEDILDISNGLSSEDKIGGERKGGTFSDSLMGITLVEGPTADGGTEGLTHLIIMGGSVLGVVRVLDANHKLRDSRLVLLPIGSQAGEAGNSQQVHGHTLLNLDAETASRPRPETHVRRGFESVAVGHDDIASVYGHEDQFVSGKHAEVQLSLERETVTLEDLKSLNGTGIVVFDTLMRSGDRALEGVAREKALALLEVLEEQPALWSNFA